MKNLSVGLSVVALLLAGFATFKTMSGGEGAGTSGTGVAKTGAVAYIDMDSLYANYEFYKELSADLKGKEIEASQKLQKEAISIGADEESFMKQAQAGLLSQNQMKQKQLELQERAKKYQEQEINIKQGLMSYQTDKNKAMLEDITSYLEEYNKEKGYSYVIQYVYGGNNMLLVDKNFDITKDVIGGLNKKYQDKKGTTTE